MGLFSSSNKSKQSSKTTIIEANKQATQGAEDSARNISQVGRYQEAGEVAQNISAYKSVLDVNIVSQKTDHGAIDAGQTIALRALENSHNAAENIMALNGQALEMVGDVNRQGQSTISNALDLVGDVTRQGQATMSNALASGLNRVSEAFRTANQVATPIDQNKALLGLLALGVVIVLAGMKRRK